MLNSFKYPLLGQEQGKRAVGGYSTKWNLIQFRRLREPSSWDNDSYSIKHKSALVLTWSISEAWYSSVLRTRDNDVGSSPRIWSISEAWRFQNTHFVTNPCDLPCQGERRPLNPDKRLQSGIYNSPRCWARTWRDRDRGRALNMFRESKHGHCPKSSRKVILFIRTYPYHPYTNRLRLSFVWILWDGRYCRRRRLEHLNHLGVQSAIVNL